MSLEPAPTTDKKIHLLKLIRVLHWELLVLPARFLLSHCSLRSSVLFP